MELQRRRQVTERFTKAIEQLGSEKLDCPLPEGPVAELWIVP
jgi:hypothetical protein